MNARTLPLLWILTSTTVADINLEQIDNNIGYHLVKFQHVQLFKENHYIHYYYNLEKIFGKFQQVKLAYENLKRLAPESSKIYKEHRDHFDLLEYNYRILRAKVTNLINHRRERRGIINGLGSIINLITGNMDNNDRQHYDSILDQLTKNQRTLQSQNNMILKTHTQLVDKINEQIKSIVSNEESLANMLRENSDQEILNMATHITLVASSLTSLYENIETSLTFCKSFTLHESLISFEDLLNVFKIYNINIHVYDFWEAVAFVKPFCKLHNNIIDIVLEIPNFENSTSSLIQLTPLPISRDGTQFILNETFQNILSSEPKLSHVSNCETFHEVNYCKLSIRPVNQCIKDLVLRRNHDNCEMYPLKFFPKVLSIPNSDKVIVNVNSDEKVFLNCSNTQKYLNFGLYKFTNDRCVIDGLEVNSVFKTNSEIPLPEIGSINPDVININREVKMHSVNRIEIENVRLKQLEELSGNIHSNITQISASALTLLAVIIAIIILVKYREKFCARRKPKNNIKPMIIFPAFKPPTP